MTHSVCIFYLHSVSSFPLLFSLPPLQQPIDSLSLKILAPHFPRPGSIDARGFSLRFCRILCSAAIARRVMREMKSVDGASTCRRESVGASWCDIQMKMVIILFTLDAGHCELSTQNMRSPISILILSFLLN